MERQGSREVDRVAAAIMADPQRFSELAGIDVVLLEQCHNCGGFHGDMDDLGDGVLGFLDAISGGRFSALLGGRFGISFSFGGFGQPRQKQALKFRLDSESEMANSPLFNKAELQAKLVEATKQRLVMLVRAKDVSLVMAKRQAEVGIDGNYAQLEQIMRLVEEANGSLRDGVGQLSVEAQGLQLFVSTLNAAGIEVSTPASDRAFGIKAATETSESTTATGDGADGKGEEATVSANDGDKGPADISTAQVARSGGEGSDDEAGKDADLKAGDGLPDPAKAKAPGAPAPAVEA